MNLPEHIQGEGMSARAAAEPYFLLPRNPPTNFRAPPRRVDHTYRDYSRTPLDELPLGKKGSTNFPAKLHRILSDPDCAHVSFDGVETPMIAPISKMRLFTVWRGKFLIPLSFPKLISSRIRFFEKWQLYIYCLSFHGQRTVMFKVRYGTVI